MNLWVCVFILVYFLLLILPFNNLFIYIATCAAAILSRVSEHKLQKCLSMELTNSLFSEDQSLWPSSDLGIAPDLQVFI